MLGVPDAVTANDYSPLDALRLAVRLESIRRPQVALLIENPESEHPEGVAQDLHGEEIGQHQPA